MTSLGALRPLQAGDRVALIAPAGPTSTERQQRAQELLRQWGLEPVTYPSSMAAHPRAVYLSGADLLRAEDLVEAWCDPAIDGIFCLRGGYGTIRVLDLLDAERMRGAAAKPLFGSSDITAVHDWLRERLGAATWFTPMIGTGSLLDDEVAVASLRAAAFQPVAGRCFAGPRAEPLATGVAHGTVIGGNLSLLALTVGARGRSVDNSGTIALLEDIGEETYRIDGYLMALLRSGWFDGVAGIALGSWLNCGPLDEIRELCLELLEPLGVPMVWELGFGHGPGALSVPLGVPATLLAERAKVALIVDSQPNRPLM
jgi:muramoyltetrapeptide carboxypeptidase